MVLISACLAGIPVRYDGGSKPDEGVIQLIKNGGEYRLFCPECMGGMRVPREPSEIVGGTAEDVLHGKARVLSKSGADITDEFIAGAKAALEYARRIKPDTVYLKERSPSCGCSCIYDGSFSGNVTDGGGITALILKENGFNVKSV